MGLDDDRDAGPSASDFSSARFINDYLETWRGIWSGQMDAWNRAWSSARSGGYDTERWIADMTELWSRWMYGAERLMSFPFHWSPRDREHPPTVVMMIDTWAEGADGEEVQVYGLGPSPSIGWTDLTPIDNPHAQDGSSLIIPKDRVLVTPAATGDRIRVRLVGLQGNPVSPTPKLVPGHYVGGVYVRGSSNNRKPLALIHLFIEGRAEDAPSSQAPTATPKNQNETKKSP